LLKFIPMIRRLRKNYKHKSHLLLDSIENIRKTETEWKEDYGTCTPLHYV